MQKLLLLTGAFLLARPSQGQIHYAPLYNYTPPPPGMHAPASWGNYTEPDFRLGAGSYQTPDGIWHTAKRMAFDATKLTIKDDAKKLVLTTATVRQFEIARDTFIVLGDLPGRPQNPRPEFLESVFYRRGTRVLQLPSGPNMRPRFFLQRPQLSLMLVTTRKEDFKKTMLAIVAGCPALVASITDDRLGPEDVPVIMQQYDVCQFGASQSTSQNK